MVEVARIARVGSLVAPAVPLGTTVGVEIARGWRPTSDDAAIAWRTFDVFSSHAPLVGAYNDASISSTHPVFDLGPLQYYLLAIPGRVDPLHGILWGAALIAAIFAALAVESAWRAGGAAAGIATSAGFVVMAATQATAVLNLPWNPNLGVFAFAAALVMSAVVATGRTAWWPVAVLAGALAAECHLVFGAASLAALAIGIGLGLVARARSRARGDDAGQHAEADTPAGSASPVRRGLLHLAIGIGVGLLAIAAPLVQQLADRTGNISANLSNLHHLGPGRGLAAGFAAIDRAAGIWPVWTHPAPPVGSGVLDLRFLEAVLLGSAAGGVTIVVVAAVIGLVALATGRKGLAALGLVAAGAGAALAWTLGAIAIPQTPVLTYVDVALWPVGMLLDVTFLWAAAALAVAFTRRPATHAVPILAGMAVLGAAIVWSVTTLVPATDHANAVIGGWDVSRAADRVTAEVERQAPKGRPFVVEPSMPLFANGLMTWSLTEAVAYQLHVHGYDVMLEHPMAPELGAYVVAAPGVTTAFSIVPGARGEWHVRRLPGPQPTKLLAWLVNR